MGKNQTKYQPQVAAQITQTTSQPLWQPLSNAQQEAATKGGYRSRVFGAGARITSWF